MQARARKAQGEDECSFGSLYFALAARQMLLNNLACMPKFYYNYIEHLDRSRYEFREGAAAEAPRPVFSVTKWAGQFHASKVNSFMRHLNTAQLHCVYRRLRLISRYVVDFCLSCVRLS